MRNRLPITCLLVISAVFLHAECAIADNKWIDVHFHIVGDRGETDGFQTAARQALKIMDRNGIGKIIVMSPPRPFQGFDIAELINIQKTHGC